MLCGASCWRGCWCEVGVACEPPVALPRPLCFPGCEGLLMCPPNPAPDGSNLGRAPKVLLPASVGDLAAIRCLALGGLPSAQQEHRAYLWLNETDTVHRGWPGPCSQERAHQAGAQLALGLDPCAHSDLCGRRWFEVGALSSLGGRMG